MVEVLGIVYRCIATHLIRKGGCTRQTARTGAVTLMMCRMHECREAQGCARAAHMLFLDGVYVERCDGSLRFRWVKVQTRAELTRLAQSIAQCIWCFLERCIASTRSVTRLLDLPHRASTSRIKRTRAATSRG
jgi:hypothetical protein